MLLMTANADGRVLNWGARPWVNEPDASTVTVQDWTKVLPDNARNYRLVNGNLVLDVLPPDATTVEHDGALSDLQTTYNALIARADQIVTQMGVINGASSMTAAQQLAAFKSIANAVADAATALKQVARLLKAVAV